MGRERDREREKVFVVVVVVVVEFLFFSNIGTPPLFLLLTFQNKNPLSFLPPGAQPVLPRKSDARASIAGRAAGSCDTSSS